MRLGDKTYEEVFRDIFGSTAEKYNMTIERKSQTTMYLVTKEFIISVGIFIAGANIEYIDLEHKRIYDLSDYIAHKTTQKEREGCSPKTSIEEIIKQSLLIRERSLVSNFSDMLLGKIELLELYKASSYYWGKPFRKDFV